MQRVCFVLVVFGTRNSFSGFSAYIACLMFILPLERIGTHQFRACGHARKGYSPVTIALRNSRLLFRMFSPCHAIRGVLSMLDEECLLPHGTDNGFVALLECQTQVTIISRCKGYTGSDVCCQFRADAKVYVFGTDFSFESVREEPLVCLVRISRAGVFGHHPRLCNGGGGGYESSPHYDFFFFFHRQRDYPVFTM